MEGNIIGTLLASAFGVLEEQSKYKCYEHLNGTIEMMKMELKFHQMFLWGLSYREELDHDWDLRFVFDSLAAKLRQIANEFVADCKIGDAPGGIKWTDLTAEMYDFKIVGAWIVGVQWLDLEVVLYDLEKKIDEQLIRPQVKDVCIRLLGGDFECTYPGRHKKFDDFVLGGDTPSFMDLIWQNLKVLLSLNLIAPVMKQQIVLVLQRLEDFNMFVGLPSRLFDLIPRVHAWLNLISCLTYLYWIDGNNESLASSMETMLYALLQKTLPCKTSGVISSHVKLTIIPQLLSRHLDFLLGNLILPVKGDIDILQEGLIFMLSFIMDPPDVDSKDREMIWAQIYSIINNFPSLIYSIRTDEMEERIFKANFSDFLIKVDRIKVKVKRLFVVVPYSSHITSPNIDAIAAGFLNVLVANMKSVLEMEVDLIPCSKHLWESLCFELEFIRPFLKNMMEVPQDDWDEASKDLRGETMNMIYNVDYFTKICLIGRFSTWYYILALPDLVEHAKFIKNQIDNLFGVDKMHKKMIGDHEQVDKTDALRSRGMVRADNNFMGFREVEEKIINDLTRGWMSLTAISISGSGGQGKTTLAKRIYDDPNVQCCFQKVVWFYVSKDFQVKDLLIQILYDGAKASGANDLGGQDLILNAWRSLKRKRYLIVLDDIWDMDAWDQLESLFPDDKNGSRILFTSRNQDLASKVELNSISHPLPLFDDKESWELMKKKVFGPTDCNRELVGIGEKIASYCKGLPLAVTLIAGVLGRTERNLDSWNKVAENLKTHLSEEGCGNVLELSYRYLPDHLKPCFLYFAAFQRGELFGAKRLKLLWMGEGFASEEGLVSKYLKDLVSLGLVVVEYWSSAMDGIKFCSVHDFIYDLCLEKAKENKFMHWEKWNRDDEQKIHSSNGLLKYNAHRLSIRESDPFIGPNPIVAKRELPTSSLHSFLCTLWASRESSLRFLESFRILTVLKLKLQVNEFPEVILSIYNLEYLSLHFEGIITFIIPPKITNLWKLKTLIIKSRPIGFALCPFVMWNMINLRYVNIQFAVLDLVGFDLENCIKSNIRSLGYLWFDADYRTTTEFLRKFPDLRNLKFCTRKRERHIMELLSIVGSLLPQLRYLKFVFGREYEENPHPIVWNFAKTNIPNLTKLKLQGANIAWSDMTEIGKQLPNLRVLKSFESCKGRSWKLEDGSFPNLVYLDLYKECLEEFDISSCEDPLPCLEKIVLHACEELVEIPPMFGEINTLKEIEVYRCSKELEASAMRILEEQIEFGNNTLQVYINQWKNYW